MDFKPQLWRDIAGQTIDGVPLPTQQPIDALTLRAFSSATFAFLILALGFFLRFSQFALAEPVLFNFELPLESALLQPAVRDGHLVRRRCNSVRAHRHQDGTNRARVAVACGRRALNRHGPRDLGHSIPP